MSNEATLINFFVGLIFIVMLARIAGSLAERLGQSRIIGDIVAGILIGPTCLSGLVPGLADLFSSGPVQNGFYLLSQLGLVLVMFEFGLDFELKLMRERLYRRATLAVAVAGMLLPFGLGAGLAVVGHEVLAPAVPKIAFALFCGVALSITAVPVLGRILQDLQLGRTAAGTVAMGAASLTDILGWFTLFAIATYVSSGFDLTELATKIGGFAAYCLLFGLLVRPILLRTLEWLERKTTLASTHTRLTLTLSVILLSSACTSALGVHAAFGGFLCGLILHRYREKLGFWSHGVTPFATAILIPIFFAYSGLNMNLRQILVPGLWIWTAAFLLCAIIGKMGASYGAARCAGISGQDSRTIAVLMNTRGLMELIVLNIGFNLGVLPATVYSMLTIMALLTTIMTVPLLRRHLGMHTVHEPVASTATTGHA